jgi:hypothetical protein
MMEFQDNIIMGINEGKTHNPEPWQAELNVYIVFSCVPRRIEDLIEDLKIYIEQANDKYRGL